MDVRPDRVAIGAITPPQSDHRSATL